MAAYKSASMEARLLFAAALCLGCGGDLGGDGTSGSDADAGSGGLTRGAGSTGTDDSPDDPGNAGATSAGDPSDSDTASAAEGGDPDADLGDQTGPGALPEGTNPGGAEVECESADPGTSPLLKLSTVQYRNTVRDVLRRSGLEDVIPSIDASLRGIPDDSLGDSFRGLDDRVSLEHVEGYFEVGVEVADAVAQDPGLLRQLVGDCVDDLSDACAEDFLRELLTLVYRRPPQGDELEAYLALNDGVRSPAQAVRAMLILALSSPRFVHHLEIDGTASQTSPSILQLTSYEIASRLSYTFWQTMPDEELMAAAEDGSLATQTGFQEQLTRVFSDPRAKDSLWQFWNEWLKLEKFTGFETARPAFQALSSDTAIGQDGHDVYGDMVNEVRELTDLFSFGRTANVAELLTTPVSVTPSEDLAALYGVEPYSGSGDYPTLPEGTRAGLLQRAALLVSNLEQTNPFHRGALVRRAVLCDDLPQPDPNSLPAGSLDPPPTDSAQTTRERFSGKVEGNALCEGCHASFSNIGYVLEAYDALGRYRDTERVFDEQSGQLLAELPIDQETTVRIGSDEVLVKGPAELNAEIVSSQKVEACLAQNYFSYALRRAPQNGSADACMVADLARGLSDPEVGIRAAFQRLVQYRHFFQRKVGPR